MRTKILWTLPVLALAFGIGIALNTQADVTQSARGWLWGGSENPSDNSMNGNETGVGWISMNNVDQNGAVVAGIAGSYGVNIPSSDGLVTGYAWWGHGSNSVDGDWLQFNVADTLPTNGSGVQQTNPCDGTTQGGVCRQGNNLFGWARFVGIKNDLAAGNSGGWEGWVKMHNVSIKADGTLEGYAWNGEKNLGGGVTEGLGWIDFSNVKISTSTGAGKTLKLCRGAADVANGSTQTYTHPSSIPYSLFFDAAPNCATATTNVTANATWQATTDNPDDVAFWEHDAVQLPLLATSNALKTKEVSGAPMGREYVMIQYIDPVTSALHPFGFTAVVVCNPSVMVADDLNLQSNTCPDETVPATNNCGQTGAVSGTNTATNCSGSGSGGHIGSWIEVAPN